MKFLKLKKLGILGIIFLLCTTCFLSGRISTAKADGSISVLPISRGGTGANLPDEARKNLNAQEQLISDTNIKTVFKNSLLGSGDVSVISQSDNLERGQKRVLSMQYTTKVLNNITFTFAGVADFQISFTAPAWSASYLEYRCASGENQMLVSGPGAVNWQLSYSSCYFTGVIVTSDSKSKFILTGVENGLDGVTIVLEKIV
ncbi:MAG: hypothetical protein LBT91_00005 [Bifidobacteriaceae bacterium]|jgi:hypothetical protein|nr:hypothetical protein [Bifidobacteriaceae bacterium]